MSRCPECDAELLDTEATAALAGVTPATWAGYVSTGIAPAAHAYVGGTPIWRAEDIETWRRERRKPGRPIGTKRSP